MATEIRVPTLGESVSEATIGKWFKKVGDAVKADEPLLELETDKVTVDVPAPAAGALATISRKEGDKVKVKLLGFDDRGKVRLSMKAVDQTTGEDLEAKAGAEGGEVQGE